MAVPITMPRQGQSVETCIITQWNKKKGDAVKTGDILFSYETDKASFDVEAPDEGIVLEIFYDDGEEVPVLTNVAVIGKKGEDAEQFRPGNAVIPIPASNPPEPIKTSAVAEITAGRIRISPRAKIMAAQLNINTTEVKGTGPNGRIIARDIEMVTGRKPVSEPFSQTKVSAPTEQAYVQFPTGYDFVDTKLSNVRKIIARSMHESISTSAQLTHHMSADVRRLLALRSRVKADMEKGGTLNITINDMVSYAVIRALEKYPALNSHFLGENIRTFKKIHLGFAVDTPRGLMVPVIKNAGDLSLKGLSEQLREVADQCRKGNVNPELLQSASASFTISNLGNYGVEIFTPIINLPQVAILGVNTIIHRPADLGNGAFGFIPMIGLSLTYDHRAVDGGPATLFLREIKTQIENFEER